MSQPTILVIDDASFTRDLVKKTLRNHFAGCNIVDVNSARRAQALMKNQHFDLIVSDWEMPEMDGEEFLLWVRSEEQHKEIPFIMVTSRGEKEFVMKAIKAGVNDYLGKPFTAEELTTKVAKQLKRLGKLPQAQRANINSVAANTISILTGGAKAADTSPAEAAPAKPAALRAVAQVNLPGFATSAVVVNCTLTTLHGLIKRGERIPTVFEPAVVSIQAGEAEQVARLNGYVHAVEAFETRQDTDKLKLTIRFVDDDPVKLEQLSKFIAGQRG